VSPRCPTRRNPGNQEPVRSLDLHGLPPAQALRRLEQELHAARVRGASELLVVTGRGWGNAEQKPVLRKQVEAWLRGEAGRRLGVIDVRVVSKGGALDLRLRPPGRSARPARAGDEGDAAEDEDSA
jgi:hypothetical protein